MNPLSPGDCLLHRRQPPNLTTLNTLLPRHTFHIEAYPLSEVCIFAAALAIPDALEIRASIIPWSATSIWGCTSRTTLNLALNLTNQAHHHIHLDVLLALHLLHHLESHPARESKRKMEKIMEQKCNKALTSLLHRQEIFQSCWTGWLPWSTDAKPHKQILNLRKWLQNTYI